MSGKWVVYLRVSTSRQGQSGLGIEAQRAAVAAFLSDNQGKLIGEYVEIESGKRDDRPRLAEALLACKRTGATLLIAKLDRLSRCAHFLLGLQKAGVPFKATDAPHADNFSVGILALVAQKEREMIAERTKAALQAAKARGVVLGGFRGHKVDGRLGAAAGRQAAEDYAAMIAPMIEKLSGEGFGLRAIAARLTEEGVASQRGGSWTATGVRNIIARYGGTAQ